MPHMEGRKRSGTVRWYKTVQQKGWFEYILNDEGERIGLIVDTRNGPSTIMYPALHSVEEKKTEHYEHE